MDVINYYKNKYVRDEIIDYSKNRWTAIESRSKGGQRLFFRYWRDGNPITISGEEDINRLIREYGFSGIRTIYSTANVYKNIQSINDLEDPTKIIYTSPIWDIDGILKNWRDIVEVARLIVEFLENKGVKKSVFLKWSGEGIHVHINERAFSKEILQKYNPLDIAYSIVEYTIKMTKDKLHSLIKNKEGLKVENVMDIKRVFTVPLSLHRKVDLCAVCFKPNEIDDFDISWANPENFRHNRNWREYKEGEGDKIAIEAIQLIKGYPGWNTKATHIHSSISTKKSKIHGKIGRFQVMALLQAARYYVLTKDIKKAKSFGLNRAIFYAWAKYYGRGYTPKRIFVRGKGGRKQKMIKAVGEQVPLSDGGWFIIGGKEQRPEDYDRQIASKINSVVPHEEAWKAAVDYIKSFNVKKLTDPQKFYEEIYKPVRDNFLTIILRRKNKSLLFFTN